MPAQAKTDFRWVKEYGLAVGVTLLALVVRFLLDPYLGDHLPYVTFFVAVAVTAWYGGPGASFTAVLLGAVLSNWFFMSPRHSLGLIGVKQQVGHLTYFMVTLAFVGFEQALRRARQHAGVATQDLQREFIERLRAEEALRETEGRYQATFANAAVGIAHVGLDGRWLRVNEAVCIITGYSGEELLARTFADITYPDDIEPSWSNAGRLLAGDISTYSMEKRYVRKSGNVIWVDLTVSLLRDADGAPQHFISIIQDIDDRKKTEEALRESQSQRADILQTMTDGFEIIDHKWRLAYMNDAARRMLREQGRDPDVLIGQRIYEDVFPDAQDSPAHRQLQRVMNERVGVEFDNFYGPWRRWYHVRAYPVQHHGIAVFMQDITERKRGEMLLAEQQQLLERIATGSPFDKCLNALTEAVSRLQPSARAAVLMAGADRSAMADCYSARLPPAFGAGMAGTPINDLTIGTCGTAIFTGEPVTCSDIAGSKYWSESWRELCLAHGIRACHSAPVFGPDGKAVASFFLCFSEARDPDTWDRRIAEFGAHMAGVAIERERMQTALRESEERLRSILNYAPAAIFIKDPAGRYLFMNEQCARVLSVNREQAFGNTDRDLFSPELAAQFMANDQRVWESGKLLAVKEQVPQADGVHTSLVQKFLLRDNQGRPYALSGIAVDITPHLQLEVAIQASEARLQLAQSAANIGVFDWDLAVQKGVWSPELEGIWGLPVGGFDGTAEAWRCLVHPDDLASVHMGTQRSLKDPTTASEFEFRIVRPDGAVRWIYAKAKTLCDAEGRAVRMVGINLDITDRKEAQLRLERFAEELEAQVEDRTRDLVQSYDRLRAMATELNLVEQRERKRLATELHDHLQQMLVLGKLTIGQGKRVAAGNPACEQLFKKVNDIFSDALTYTRTLVSDLSPTVLRDQGLAAALQWLGTYMQKHEQTVTVTVSEDRDLRLPEDQVILLFQSVRELLINSAKHAGTGRASLVMEQREENLCITVSDEGKGFDFAAVTSVGVTAGTASGGISSKYGLLSIQERMRALGGSFEIHSVPGQGTTATLLLPLARNGEVEGNVKAVGPKKRPSSTVASTLQPPASRIRVLLVDDHIMVRQGLRVILDAYADIELVGEAANGEEAVRLVDQLRPTVVVMDINMPKMNGIEATERIKRRYPDTIVVGLSVNAAKENEEAMKQAGAVGLMTKEAAVEQLYDVIVEAVKKRE